MQGLVPTDNKSAGGGLWGGSVIFHVCEGRLACSRPSGRRHNL